MHPKVKAFFDEATNTISYVVSDPSTKACAVVDSVLDYDPAAARTNTASADRIIQYVQEQQLRCEWVLETHVHADHVTAAPHIRKALGGRVGIGAHIRTVQRTFGNIFNVGQEFSQDGKQFDELFEEGDEFKIGELNVRVMHTPGHTPACLTYVIEDAAFVGDTLFMPDYGTARADFPGGDARTLYRSVQKLYALPDETRLFLCHDYLSEGRDHHQWQTTVREQRQHNIHIHEGVDEDEFVTMREKRDATLGMPKLILPSIQINMRAGSFPPKEDNGMSYLKLPLNHF